jgi:polyisoprenoid-binding protein YceI
VRLSRIFLGVAMIALMAGGAVAETWNIDATHSTVGFKVRHFFSKQAGEFNEFSGTIDFDPANPETAAAEVTIQVASIDTDNDGRDNHLRSADFFDAEQFPTMIFKSTKIVRGGDGFMVTGDLTMHGVTKEVSFEMAFMGHGPDAWGGTRAGFSAELELDRKDFGIVWNNTLDAGGTVLGDEVTVNLEIEAVLHTEEVGR